jgi:hypothetical protein
MHSTQDALTRYADSKPRTMDWLLKLIDAMYRGKVVSDEQRAKQGQEPLSLVEYMFQHLTGEGWAQAGGRGGCQKVLPCAAGSPRECGHMSGPSLGFVTPRAVGMAARCGPAGCAPSTCSSCCLPNA